MKTKITFSSKDWKRLKSTKGNAADFFAHFYHIVLEKMNLWELMKFSNRVPNVAGFIVCKEFEDRFLRMCERKYKLTPADLSWLNLQWGPAIVGKKPTLQKNEVLVDLDKCFTHKVAR